MSSSIASISDAKAFFEKLFEEIEVSLNDTQQGELLTLINASDEFFKLTDAIDLKAEDGQIIVAEAATEIGDHGLSLISKLIEVLQDLDLKHKRQEVEQISLIFSTWIIQYDGKIKSLESIVNALALAANLANSKKSLEALCDLMSEIVFACSDEIKQDFESVDLFRPWRLLLINRGITATRTNKKSLMIKAFDDLQRYLPQDAPGFFKEGLAEMDDNDYPESVKQVLIEYNSSLESLRVH